MPVGGRYKNTKYGHNASGCHVCRRAEMEGESMKERETEMERLIMERDAFKAQADDVVEIDIDDMERVIKAAKSLGKDSIKLSARDLWRMASDRRGRDEPDEEWDDD